MDDMQGKMESLKRVIERLSKFRDDGFSQRMVEILQAELARCGAADPQSSASEVPEPSEQVA